MSIAMPTGGGTHMRVAPGTDGSPVVDAVYIHGPEITASTLQAIPISHLAAALSFASSLYVWLTALKFAAFASVYPIHVEGVEPSLSALRDQATDAPASLRLIEKIRPERQKLTRPDGTDPDGFAEQVAAAYREFVMETHTPALKIAEEAGVPAATARGWIREARRRGKLPQGHKGKAG